MVNFIDFKKSIKIIKKYFYKDNIIMGEEKEFLKIL